MRFLQDGRCYGVLGRFAKHASAGHDLNRSEENDRVMSVVPIRGIPSRARSPRCFSPTRSNFLAKGEGTCSELDTVRVTYKLYLG